MRPVTGPEIPSAFRMEVQDDRGDWHDVTQGVRDPFAWIPTEPRWTLNGLAVIRSWYVPRGSIIQAERSIHIHPFDLANLLVQMGEVARGIEILTEALQEQIRGAGTPTFDQAVLDAEEAQVRRNDRTIRYLRSLAGGEVLGPHTIASIFQPTRCACGQPIHAGSQWIPT